MNWRLERELTQGGAGGHAQTCVLVALLQIETDGAPPTIAELADRTFMSKSQVHKWLTRLRTAGLVKWEDGRARTLRSNVAIVIPRVATIDGAGAEERRRPPTKATVGGRFASG